MFQIVIRSYDIMSSTTCIWFSILSCGKGTEHETVAAGVEGQHEITRQSRPNCDVTCRETLWSVCVSSRFLAAPMCETFTRLVGFRKLMDAYILRIMQFNRYVNPSQMPRRSNDETSVVILISTVFLPPLAAFLLKGCGHEVIVAICLCILGWFPGIVYAVYLWMCAGGFGNQVSAKRRIDNFKQRSRAHYYSGRSTTTTKASPRQGTAPTSSVLAAATVAAQSDVTRTGGNAQTPRLPSDATRKPRLTGARKPFTSLRTAEPTRQQTGASASVATVKRALPPIQPPNTDVGNSQAVESVAAVESITTGIDAPIQPISVSDQCCAVATSESMAAAPGEPVGRQISTTADTEQEAATTVSEGLETPKKSLQQKIISNFKEAANKVTVRKAPGTPVSKAGPVNPQISTIRMSREEQSQ